MVSKQVDYAESDKLISFYVRESWKILNFNYVSYQYSNVSKPWTKCHTLMCASPKLNVGL